MRRVVHLRVGGIPSREGVLGFLEGKVGSPLCTVYMSWCTYHFLPRYFMYAYIVSLSRHSVSFAAMG